MSRIILGLDPGLATIGYAILSVSKEQSSILDFGVIRTSAHDDFSLRLKNIQDDLMAIIDQYHPTQSYIEDLFFSANTKTALQVSHARGVLIGTLASAHIAVTTLTPNQIKNAVTGDGRADKRQIQTMLKRVFGLESFPKPDDAADALAIAYAGSLAISKNPS